mgnify:CR=1 FL=1
MKNNSLYLQNMVQGGEDNLLLNKLPSSFLCVLNKQILIYLFLM